MTTDIDKILAEWDQAEWALGWAVYGGGRPKTPEAWEARQKEAEAGWPTVGAACDRCSIIVELLAGWCVADGTVDSEPLYRLRQTLDEYHRALCHGGDLIDGECAHAKL